MESTEIIKPVPMDYKSEADLQAKCTMWFRQSYPLQYNKLFLVYNNPPNAIVGSKLKTMGLQRGAADQVYYAPNKVKVWLEYKLGNKSQTEEQLLFQAMVVEYGELYYVVKSLEQFQYLITKLN